MTPPQQGTTPYLENFIHALGDRQASIASAKIPPASESSPNRVQLAASSFLVRTSNLVYDQASSAEIRGAAQRAAFLHADIESRWGPSGVAFQPHPCEFESTPL